jgi:hypothetical protein
MHIEVEALKLAGGRGNLRRRAAIGLRCIALAHDGPWTALEDVNEEDRETAASDAISDILTALFGPPGTTTCGGHITLGSDALVGAQRFLRRAFHSYEGDAEDYYRKPEPGEYGYEDETAEYVSDLPNAARAVLGAKPPREDDLRRLADALADHDHH